MSTNWNTGLWTYETTALAKAFWSAAIVLGLSAVAERVSIRIAGILAGAPQNVMLVYFFVGRDMGIHHVTQSAPHAVGPSRRPSPLRWLTIGGRPLSPAIRPLLAR